MSNNLQLQFYLIVLSLGLLTGSCSKSETHHTTRFEVPETGKKVGIYYFEP